MLADAGQAVATVRLRLTVRSRKPATDQGQRYVKKWMLV